MSYRTREVLESVSCDGFDCTKQYSVGAATSTLDRMRMVDTCALRCGWTIWVGRARYHYCPECSRRYPTPRGRKTMRQELEA